MDSGPLVALVVAATFPAWVLAALTWKLVWPRKGRGHTYVKYEFDRRVERAIRPDLREFSVVDDPLTA